MLEVYAIKMRVGSSGLIATACCSLGAEENNNGNINAEEWKNRANNGTDNGNSIYNSRKQCSCFACRAAIAGAWLLLLNPTDQLTKFPERK